MPTYDYKCSVCNYTFEYFQSMKDQPLTTCPKCGGQLKRLIGPGAGPIFKGNGFYQTDYKNNSNNSNSGSSKKNNTKSESTVKETAA
ncbi:MAG: zinc ribbon domain-containing protein [Ignavibacterium sp.]|uniref:FmdB family zinc ribbon protein n=1 Tax=Ignavibacterium sp. TaxID=2651167 RepID=UPI003299749B